jgi:hypothetical protein
MRENDHAQNEPKFKKKKEHEKQTKNHDFRGKYKRNEKKEGTHHCCDFPKLLWF